MRTTICTLFERDYHLGLAVLLNSFAAAGYAGTVHAGFRGPLPSWADDRVRMIASGRWEMDIKPGLRAVFHLLETEAHFTNYKPEFLLQIASLPGEEEATLVYCDPDIVVNESWDYFEDWLSCGVALCEDVNSPFPESHPKRIGWRRFFQPHGFALRPRGAAYANGGFVSVRAQDRKFLAVWRDLLNLAAASLGGRDVAGIPGGRMLEGRYGFADCFRHVDQDTLNAALEACPDIEVSFLGPQAMGFQAGTPILPHALGLAKPWRRRYAAEALDGRPPETVDKIFWHHAAGGPLRPFSAMEIARRRFALTFGSALGRFMRRA